MSHAGSDSEYNLPPKPVLQNHGSTVSGTIHWNRSILHRKPKWHSKITVVNRRYIYIFKCFVSIVMLVFRGCKSHVLKSVPKTNRGETEAFTMPQYFHAVLVAWHRTEHGLCKEHLFTKQDALLGTNISPTKAVLKTMFFSQGGIC